MERVEYITRKELKEEVNKMLPKATVAQYRWMYSYLKDLEEWPIVTDYQVPPQDD